MRYFFDTEFIENGSTIDLISIGMVSEDGRELYYQYTDCDFTKADDWVARNVFPHLGHFDMGKQKRSCSAFRPISGGGNGACNSSECPWRSHWAIRDVVLEFAMPGDKPEFWAYYADYDWVAFCQLFGRMIDLPKGYPMYCRDLKQVADMLGVERNQFPPNPSSMHNALSDAAWNKKLYGYLNDYISEHVDVSWGTLIL